MKRKPQFTKQPELGVQARKIGVTGMAFIEETMPGADDYDKICAFLMFIGGASYMAEHLGEQVLATQIRASANHAMEETGLVDK